MSVITKGTTSVSRYIMLRDSADGTPETGYTITDLDLQYTRSGAAPAAKVDATALAATDSAWDDNKAIEVDSTSSPGLIRVDWPNAAFATGVDNVILVVSGTGLDPAVEEIELTGFDLQTATQKVDVDTIKTQTVTCAAATTVQPTVGLPAAKATQLEAAIGTAKVAASIAAGDIATDAITAAALKADANTEIAAAVDSLLVSEHGEGLWQPATGFATPTNITSASGVGLAADQAVNVTKVKGTTIADLTDTDKLQVSVQHKLATLDLTDEEKSAIQSITGGGL